MATREIKIYMLAKTKIDHAVAGQWLQDLGVDLVKFCGKVPENLHDRPAMVVALAGKRCYMSFEEGLNKNVKSIRDDYAEYFENILAKGHGSVLEHAVYSFAIENCTRVFTAEMNRHRAGWGISEGSLRFIRFDKEIPYWLPTSLRDGPNDDQDLLQKKALSRELFAKAFAHQEQIYAQLMNIWDMDEKNKNFSYKKKVTSCLRRIVGLGVCTGGIWTGNIRALRHVIAMRASPEAEEEILLVFTQIAQMMAKEEPFLFGDFKQDERGFWRPKYAKV